MLSILIFSIVFVISVRIESRGNELALREIAILQRGILGGPVRSTRWPKPNTHTCARKSISYPKP
jgi:hypothetical protein